MKPQELARIRKVLGLSREQLGDALGVTGVTVWRWEAGERKISEPAARLVKRLVKEKRKR